MVSTMGIWARLTGRRRTVTPPPAPPARPAPPATRTARPATDRPRTVTQPPPAHVPPLRSSDYLPPDAEARSFTLAEGGMPTGRLRHVRDRLVIVTDDGAGMVNPASRTLHRNGIYCLRLRGTAYHREAMLAGDFRPGRSVRLEREPDNPHDPNAVAVYADGATALAGYVNKLNARRIAARLDAGETLEAVSVRGSGPGKEGAVPWILVAAPDVLAHLRR